MRLFLTLIIIVLLALAFIFGSQNNQTLTLNYLIAESQMSVATAVSIFTTIGVIIGLLIALLWKVSRLLKSKNVK
ncbi:lipopolysaccharide assembly protein LapA domain-containing protein [Thalassotalea ganghwensis]